MNKNQGYEKVKKVIDEFLSNCKEGSFIFRGENAIPDNEGKIKSSLYRKYEGYDIWSEKFNPIDVEKEIALYHNLGKLPEPPLITHRFF